MSVTHIFLAAFTKSKVKTTPANAPTVVVGDVIGDSLLSTGNAVLLTTFTAGVYKYTYTTNTLTVLPLAVFNTADTTVDSQDLFSFPLVTIDANGNVRVNVQSWLDQSVQAAVNGIPKVDLAYILGTLITESVAGRDAASLTKFLDVATPVFTAESVNQTADVKAQVPQVVEFATIGGRHYVMIDAEAWAGAGLPSILVPQDVRDAMKLTPTAGVEPPTSIDGKLNGLVPGAAIVLNDDETTIVVNS